MLPPNIIVFAHPFINLFSLFISLFSLLVFINRPWLPEIKEVCFKRKFKGINSRLIGINWRHHFFVSDYMHICARNIVLPVRMYILHYIGGVEHQPTNLCTDPLLSSGQLRPYLFSGQIHSGTARDRKKKYFFHCRLIIAGRWA